MICTILCCVRSVSLDIWLVERCYCFWPFCFSGFASLSAVVTFSSVCVRFILPVSCLWSYFLFPKSLSLTCWVYSFCSLTSKLLPVFSEDCFLHWYTFLISTFISIAKWHIAIPVYRYCIKNYYLQCCCLLLFTNIRNVSGAKPNLISARKFSKKSFSEYIFCICFMVI